MGVGKYLTVPRMPFSPYPSSSLLYSLSLLLIKYLNLLIHLPHIKVNYCIHIWVISGDPIQICPIGSSSLEPIKIFILKVHLIKIHWVLGLPSLSSSGEFQWMAVSYLAPCLEFGSALSKSSFVAKLSGEGKPVDYSKVWIQKDVIL